MGPVLAVCHCGKIGTYAAAQSDAGDMHPSPCSKRTPLRAPACYVVVGQHVGHTQWPRRYELVLLESQYSFVHQQVDEVRSTLSSLPCLRAPTVRIVQGGIVRQNAGSNARVAGFHQQRCCSLYTALLAKTPGSAWFALE